MDKNKFPQVWSDFLNATSNAWKHVLKVAKEKATVVLV